MPENCIDNNIPTVDETAIECCSLIPANCVVASERNTFLGIGVGRTLTYVIDRIARAIRDVRTSVSLLEQRFNYREYEALLTQTSTNNPQATIGFNNFAANPALVYVSPGQYNIVLLNAFPAGNTFIYLGTSDLGWDTKVKAYRLDDSTIRVASGNTTDFIDNGLIQNLPIKIKVNN